VATKIERDFRFMAGVHFEKKFIMNVYEVKLGMEVETESILEQNIAMDRIIYFLGECLSDSVLIDSKETQSIDHYIKAGMKVCTLPEEPYDQIIAMLLILKCNFITEGRLLIRHIELKSELSDNVKFIYDVESAANNPFDRKSWWLDKSPSICDTFKNNKKDKIVKLTKILDWKTVGLEWEDETNVTDILELKNEVNKPE